MTHTLSSVYLLPVTWSDARVTQSGDDRKIRLIDTKEQDNAIAIHTIALCCASVWKDMVSTFGEQFQIRLVTTAMQAGSIHTPHTDQE